MEESDHQLSHSGSRSRSKSPALSRSSNKLELGIAAGIAAGAALAIGAIGARMLRRRKDSRPVVALTGRKPGERRKLPPRRPRSTASATSTPTSPVASPTKPTRPGPILKPRGSSSSSNAATAASASSDKRTSSSRPKLPPRGAVQRTQRSGSNAIAPRDEGAAQPKSEETASDTAPVSAPDDIKKESKGEDTVKEAEAKNDDVAPVNKPVSHIESADAAAVVTGASAAAAISAAVLKDKESTEPSAENKLEGERDSAANEEGPSSQEEQDTVRSSEIDAVTVDAPSRDSASEQEKMLEVGGKAEDSSAEGQTSPAAMGTEEEVSKGEEPIDAQERVASNQDAVNDNSPEAAGKEQEDSIEPKEANVSETSEDREAFASQPILPPLVPDEPDDQVEHIEDIEVATLSFDNAPSNDQPLNEAEEKVRAMSMHAHKLIRETAAGSNRLPAALKEQQAAVELCTTGEAAGKVRPALLAACAFQLADMYEGYRKFEDAKRSLAVAHAAALHVEAKGALVRSLMNFGNLIRSTDKKKPRSVRETFEVALELSRKEMGISHPTTFTVKNELAAHLANTGRLDDAVKLLLDGAEELSREADRMEKEEAQKGEMKNDDTKTIEGSAGKETDGKTSSATEQPESEADAADKAIGTDKNKPADDSHTEFKDPGSGLEHIAATNEAGGVESTEAEKKLHPSAQAKHFAMRNYLTTAALLDRQRKFDQSHDVLVKAMELALGVYGENSPQHMNVLYVVGQHLSQRGDLDGAIEAHETVLSIMDETIEVYDPELLQNRVSVLRDTAILYDKKGEVEVALDYAQGALVNAQTLAKLAAPNAPPGFVGSFMETYWLLLANLKAKAGDSEGAADARRQALRGKLNTSQPHGRGGKPGRSGARSGGQSKRNTSAASSTRAGGRRV